VIGHKPEKMQSDAINQQKHNEPNRTEQPAFALRERRNQTAKAKFPQDSTPVGLPFRRRWNPCGSFRFCAVTNQKTN
jgi:hypothetical protein